MAQWQMKHQEAEREHEVSFFLSLHVKVYTIVIEVLHSPPR